MSRLCIVERHDGARRVYYNRLPYSLFRLFLRIRGWKVYPYIRFETEYQADQPSGEE